MNLSWDKLIPSVLAEINSQDWFTHVEEISGNASICFVSVGGTQNNDFVLSGQLEITPLLRQYPAIKKILLALNQPVARVRLMRLPAQTRTQSHPHYYQYFRYQSLYIPIKTTAELYFYQGKASFKLEQGMAFSFQQTAHQSMENKSKETVIYLVIEYLATQNVCNGFEIKPLDKIELTSQSGQPLLCKQPYFTVFTPTELQKLTNTLLVLIQKLEIEDKKLLLLQQKILLFNQQWQTCFQQFGHNSKGELAYSHLILQFREQVFPLIRFQFKQLDFVGQGIFEIINSLLLTTPSLPKRLNRHLLNTQSRKRRNNDKPIITASFIRPVFIVSAPRAGSTLLFNCLSQSTDLWTTGEENHELLENIAGLHPADKNYCSNRLLAEDANDKIALELCQRFSQRLVNKRGVFYQDLRGEARPSKIHFLEKTPKNSLRIPFIKALFPDAAFIYLYREPCANINSLMEGWRSRRFIAYKTLPNWPFKEWSFLLTPQWQSFNKSSLVEITAYQWKIANEMIINDIQQLPTTDWTMLSYEQLIKNPEKQLQQLIKFMQLRWDSSKQALTPQNLPITPVTLSSPQVDKWKKHHQELTTISAIIEPTVEMIEVLKIEK